MKSLKPFIISLAIYSTLNYSIGTKAVEASTVERGWWDGSWVCKIDGRPAKMKWYIADNSNQSCDEDGICTSTSAVAWRGKFSDNGSSWVPLTSLVKGKKGGIFFRHADGNQWYLNRPTNNNTSGWTTWNGKRYPLSCTK